MSSTEDWDQTLWDESDQEEEPGSAVTEQPGEITPAAKKPRRRLRDRVQETRDYYLQNAVPRDEDQPLPEGTVAEALMRTPLRKAACLVVACSIGALLIWLAPL